MSNTEIEAALAWADRIERGEGSYDPYLVALAHLVRDLRTKVSALETLLGIGGTEKPLDWDDVLRELVDARTRADGLTAQVRLIDPQDIGGAGRMTLDGTEYRIIEESEVKHLTRAIENARALLPDEEVGS